MRGRADGLATVRLGGRNGSVPTFPIVPRWNSMVRLYRPRAKILDATWAPAVRLLT